MLKVTCYKVLLPVALANITFIGKSIANFDLEHIPTSQGKVLLFYKETSRRRVLLVLSMN